jgi:putative flippase GtrA
MQRTMNRLRNHRSAARYLAVGVASLAVDYGLLLTFYHIAHAPLAVATTIGFLIGLTLNFLLNKYWTFEVAPRGAKHGTRQAVLYALLVVFNLGFTNLIILSLHRHIGPEITKPLTTAIITLWNYVLYQRVIFKVHTPTDLERSIM